MYEPAASRERPASSAHERQHLVDVGGRAERTARLDKGGEAVVGDDVVLRLTGRLERDSGQGRHLLDQPLVGLRELAPGPLLRELEHAQDLVVADDRRVQGGELSPVVHTLGATGLPVDLRVLHEDGPLRDSISEPGKSVEVLELPDPFLVALGQLPRPDRLAAKRAFVREVLVDAAFEAVERLGETRGQRDQGVCQRGRITLVVDDEREGMLGHRDDGSVVGWPAATSSAAKPAK